MVKKPTLLLSPDGSWDANGRVQPTITGGVRVVPGQYGNAWQTAEATTNLHTNPSAEVDLTRISIADGTVERTDEQAYIGDYSVKAVSSGNLPRISTFTNLTAGQTISFSAWVYHELGIDRVFQTSGLSSNVDHIVPSGVWTRIGHSGVAVGGTTYFQFRLAGSAVGEVFYIDAIQIEEKPYATPYIDGSMPNGSWTGTPHASTSTRSQASVESEAWNPKASGGTMLVRYRQHSNPALSTNAYIVATGSTASLFISPRANATSRNTVLYIDGISQGDRFSPAGLPTVPIGTPSAVSVTWDANMIRMLTLEGGRTEADITGLSSVDGTAMIVLGMLSPTSVTVSNVDIESALFFDTALTDAEIADVMAMQSWQVLNPYAGNTRIPYQSSVITFEREVFIADGNNNIIEDITPLVRSVSTDIDAARGDSKVEATIETYTDPIADGDWVAIYHTLTPERGDIIRRQRCLVRVETPRIQYTGGGEEIGISTGRDIIRDLAMATLDIPFYTPHAGMVMPDVEAAIRMLGITSLGANIVPNGSFESGIADWTFSGATYDAMQNNHSGVAGAPDGNWVGLHRIPAATAHPSYGLVSKAITSQVAAAIAAGAKQFFFSAFVYTLSSLTVEHMLEMVFVTPSGNKYYNTGYKKTGNGWERLYGVMTIPDDYAGGSVQIHVASRPREEHSPLAASGTVAIDDIQVRPCTGDLLPVSMLALPPSTTRASSRIQNGIGDYILEAVDVRLKAIGIHPPYTTPDGRPTSRPILASEQDTASRSYDIDDDRIADTVRIEASPSERANKVMAVKEVHDAPPLVATVYNRNPDDQYSLENYPPRGVRISMYDAVDVDALRAAALDELSRRVVRDEISFKIMPDPDINIHDVIEVTGPPEDRRVGRWIVIAIRDGSSGSDPAMEILARRVSLGEWS